VSGRFQKSGDSLILKVGASDQITFTDYYANAANRSVDKLQRATDSVEREIHPRKRESEFVVASWPTVPARNDVRFWPPHPDSVVAQ
jgi:hypothetical protein